MRIIFGGWFLFLFLLSIPGLQAQTSENAFFLQAESDELKPIAKQILYHDSSAYKFELNKQFGKRLMEMLVLPGSFEFPFDSLPTISKLTAPDLSFRIFSWYIVDEDKDHFYYALLQRKVKTASGKDSLFVISLNHTQLIDQNVESRQLDNNKWIGALYYKIKLYQAKGYKKNLSTGKVEKTLNNYYLLFGWNGGTKFSSYKMLDILTFDEETPDKISLGAPLFYFSMIPKYRVVFEYSDNSPFRLNTDMVKRKWPRKPVEMIVFDHLAPPSSNSKKHEMFDYGADGSYDGIYFRKRRGGNFGYYKNIRVIDKRLDKYKSKDITAPKLPVQKGLFPN